MSRLLTRLYTFALVAAGAVSAAPEPGPGWLAPRPGECMSAAAPRLSLMSWDDGSASEVYTRPLVLAVGFAALVALASGRFVVRRLRIAARPRATDLGPVSSATFACFLVLWGMATFFRLASQAHHFDALAWQRVTSVERSTYVPALGPLLTFELGAAAFVLVGIVLVASLLCRRWSGLANAFATLLVAHALSVCIDVLLVRTWLDPLARAARSDVQFAALGVGWALFLAYRTRESAPLSGDLLHAARTSLDINRAARGSH